MVYICMTQLLYDLIRARSRESPIREMSFIAIVVATRGKWWDDQVYGLCSSPKREMRKRTSDKVTFGVDSENREHIGFAPHTTRIRWNERYQGKI
jgi:hypothetical protein